MKPILSCLIFQFFTLCATAQPPNKVANKPEPCADCPCLLAQAKDYDRAADYENALMKYQSYRTCAPENAKATDEAIRKLLQKANNDRKRAEKNEQEARATLQKANQNMARYYVSEARQLHAQYNSNLAYLLANEAIKRDINNKDAIKLKDELLPYLGTHTYQLKSNFFDCESSFSPDSNYLSISPDSNLYIFQINKPNKIIKIPNSIGHIFSKTGKYLNYISIKNKDTILTILKLDQPEKKFQFKIDDSSLGLEYSHRDNYLFYFSDADSSKANLNFVDLSNQGKVTQYANVSKYFDNTSLRYPNENDFFWFTSSTFDTLYVVRYDQPNQVMKFTDVGIDLHLNPFISSNSKYLVYFNQYQYAPNEKKGTLNLVFLDQKNRTMQFENAYAMDDKFSFSNDCQKFIFFNEINDSTFLNLINLNDSTKNCRFSNAAVGSLDDFYSSGDTYVFNKNDRSLLFYTFSNDSSEQTYTLNIINTEDPQKLLQFNNVEYSYDATKYFKKIDRYFLFYSNTKQDSLSLVDLENHNSPKFKITRSGIFNQNYLLSLDKNKLNIINLEFPEKMNSVSFSDSLGRLINATFAKNNHFFAFNHEVYNNNIYRYRPTGSLNLVFLDSNNKIIHFTNTFISPPDYLEGRLEYKIYYPIKLNNEEESDAEASGFRFSDDNKYFFFFTFNNDSTMFNILPISKYREEQNNLISLPWSVTKIFFEINSTGPFSVEPKENNSQKYIHNYRYFQSQEILSIQVNNTLEFHNLPNHNEIGTYLNKSGVKCYTLSKDNRWLFIFTEKRILKIIDLHVTPDQRRVHYDRVLSFTKEEKVRYGIE